MISNAMNDEPLPVYGDGKNVRDWIFVEDHARAIWLAYEKGKSGESYNIGARTSGKTSKSSKRSSTRSANRTA